MSTNDGGPAFPTTTDRVLIDPKANLIQPCQFGGMTLRDYFAAKAMQALISLLEKDIEYSVLAKNAYEFADAMLAEREAKRD